MHVHVCTVLAWPMLGRTLLAILYAPVCIEVIAELWVLESEQVLINARRACARGLR